MCGLRKMKIYIYIYFFFKVSHEYKYFKGKFMTDRLFFVMWGKCCFVYTHNLM